ncbi:MAG TPA: hypothetical protein VGU25_10795 [Acidobacteriaceae bacterium]|nr:hypothetical protein [Acidobacteriaceae bacterium]
MGLVRRVWSSPVALLVVAVALLTTIIQSGELGTADTTRRLQVTHSLWTPQPQVPQADYPEFGIPGRGGRLYAWYGIGQSLLMLPADVVGTAAADAPWWRGYQESGATPRIRAIVVSASTNVLLNVLTALVALRFLGLLEFSRAQSFAGTLALIVATTHLHYAQNMQENNYIFLLTLTGMWLQLRWADTSERRWLWWGAGALGLNLLTRLTTALDVIGVALFLLLLGVFARRDGSPRAELLSARRVKEYLHTVLPVYAAFLFLDRLYQFVRFGSWTSTYMRLQSNEQIKHEPTLPKNFPFSGHWFQGGVHSGLLGPLFEPEKSIFVFDPLFGMALLLTALLWRRMTPVLRAYAVATLVLLAAYMVLYARYFAWAGDFAWGDRYISSVVEMFAMLAVPLLMRYRHELGRGVRAVGWCVVAASVVIQAASLAFWLPVEIYQIDAMHHDAWTVALRFRNIWTLMSGRPMLAGVDVPGALGDSFDELHMRVWNFMPALMRHVGVAPLWVVRLLDAVWVAMAVALVCVVVRLWRTLSVPAPQAG